MNLVLLEAATHHSLLYADVEADFFMQLGRSGEVSCRQVLPLAGIPRMHLP